MDTVKLWLISLLLYILTPLKLSYLYFCASYSCFILYAENQGFWSLCICFSYHAYELLNYEENGYIRSETCGENKYISLVCIECLFMKTYDCWGAVLSQFTRQIPVIQMFPNNHLGERCNLAISSQPLSITTRKYHPRF